MKTKMILALLSTFILLSGTAFAFHGGGVAHCDGCHSMHNSADNPRSGSATANNLMKGSDPSSTCMNCHSFQNGTSGYDVVSEFGTDLSQGGDYFWVANDYTWPGRHGDNTSLGDQHGHNIVAAGFGFTADAANATSPGGNYPSANFGCTDCHNPHGEVAGATGPISVSGSYGAADPTDGSIHGNYRLLGDTGFKSINTPAPIARANSSSGTQTQYGQGMSAWCLNCHGLYNNPNEMHPINEPVPTTYNSYVSSGDMSGGVATAYDSLVPFERGIDDGSLLTIGSTAGVEDVNDVVMCLSCHRAHASAFDNILRWDYTSSELLVESGIFEAGGTAETLIANGAIPYHKDGVAIDIATEYNQYQRSLCNKCHAKD
ncbi:MAG: hypothetical protein JXQ81_00415 [Desulfuromonadales bacterium]|nr:hypothetical protein [Desulfuromonadales bacterium]MBN2790946.1 hypothetical protein [Desulfuromonadales bacterium]